MKGRLELTAEPPCIHSLGMMDAITYSKRLRTATGFLFWRKSTQMSCSEKFLEADPTNLSTIDI